MMLVKVVNSATVPGGKAVVLCDDNGQPLPMQTGALLETRCGEASTITVTFIVDGEHVRFDPA